MSENEMTLKQKLRYYLNPPWNFCVNQIKKIIDMTNLAEHCQKTENDSDLYTPVPMTPDSVIFNRDEETQTDNIQESPKRKRAKFAQQKQFSEVFGDDDDRSGKFSLNYSADISEMELSPDNPPYYETLYESESNPFRPNIYFNEYQYP